MFQTLMNENVVAGLSPRNDWQQGISNYDSGGTNLEKASSFLTSLTREFLTSGTIVRLIVILILG